MFLFNFMTTIFYYYQIECDTFKSLDKVINSPNSF